MLEPSPNDAPSDPLPPRNAAASDPTDADLERGILHAVGKGLFDVARTLAAQLARQRARGGNVVAVVNDGVWATWQLRRACDYRSHALLVVNAGDCLEVARTLWCMGAECVVLTLDGARGPAFGEQRTAAREVT